MKKPILAGVAGLALIAAMPVLAASAPSPIRSDPVQLKIDCHGLKQEFDFAEPYARTKPKLAIAKSLRGEGGKLCHEGQFVGGIATLRQALHDLGIQPFTKSDPMEDIG